MTETNLFTSGDGGYNTYRIPSLFTTRAGSILAFCEGRKANWHDKSPTDLLMRRSTDGGDSWSVQSIVVPGVPDAIMDPCPVQDRVTGTICLLFDRYPQGFDFRTGLGMDSATCWLCRSDDDGATWSDPENITEATKRPEWSGVAHGPGIGIQTRDGSLIVPCNYLEGDRRETAISGCYQTISNDHGKTWHMGGTTGPRVDESQIVELADGRLMLNMRSNLRSACRAQAFSADGGMTWTPPVDVPALTEPVCQGSIIRYPAKHGKGDRVLLFANPAHRERRIAMTVRISRDDGETWLDSRVINPGGSAYSSLATFPDGSIGLLYEKIDYSSFDKSAGTRPVGWMSLSLARFSIEWIESGEPVLPRDQT